MRPVNARLRNAGYRNISLKIALSLNGPVLNLFDAFSVGFEVDSVPRVTLADAPLPWAILLVAVGDESKTQIAPQGPFIDKTPYSAYDCPKWQSQLSRIKDNKNEYDHR
jgi:hypothetical protein